MNFSRQLKAASIFSAIGFSVNASIILAWYVILTWFYPARESGELLLGVSAAGLICLVDFGISVHVTGRVATLNHRGCRADAGKLGLDALTMAAVLSLVAASLTAGVILAGGWLRDISVSALIAFVVLAVSLECTSISIGILKGFLQFKTLASCQVAAALIPYGVSTVQLLRHANVENVFVLFSIASSVSALIVVAVALTICRRALLIPAVEIGVPYPPTLHRWYSLLKGGCAFFPQQLPGLFFNYALRFVVGLSAGIEFVTPVSLAYTVAARLHAFANSFLEMIYPLGRGIVNAGIVAHQIEMILWKRAFPIFAAIVAVITAATARSSEANAALILLFCCGTWAALLGAPTFHLANALGNGARVSALSVLTIPVFAVLATALTLGLSAKAWVFGLAYLGTQALFLTLLQRMSLDRGAMRASDVSSSS